MADKGPPASLASAATTSVGPGVVIQSIWPESWPRNRSARGATSNPQRPSTPSSHRRGHRGARTGGRPRGRGRRSRQRRERRSRARPPGRSPQSRLGTVLDRHDEQVGRKRDEEDEQGIATRFLGVPEEEGVDCEQDCCDDRGAPVEETFDEQIERRWGCRREQDGERANSELALAERKPNVEQHVVG